MGIWELCQDLLCRGEWKIHALSLFAWTPAGTYLIGALKIEIGTIGKMWHVVHVGNCGMGPSFPPYSRTIIRPLLTVFLLVVLQ